jgi:hypothetical protein
LRGFQLFIKQRLIVSHSIAFLSRVRCHSILYQLTICNKHSADVISNGVTKHQPVFVHKLIGHYWVIEPNKQLCGVFINNSSV